MIAAARGCCRSLENHQALAAAVGSIRSAFRRGEPSIRHLFGGDSEVDVKAMKFLVLAVGLCMGQAALAQITSPPPICFAFNDVGSGTPTGTIAFACGSWFPSASLVAHFMAPSAAAVDLVEIWKPGQGTHTIIDLYATAFMGGPFVGPALGTFWGDYQNAGWDACWTAAPVNLVSGASYAVQIRQVPGAPQTVFSCGCYTISFDPAGTTLLPYQYGPGPCTPSLPSHVGQVALPLRFRGLACGPGPLASVQFVQSDGPCGGSTYWSQLTFTVPPVLGLPFPVSITGPGGETAFLFWSLGVSQSGGAPLAAGSACLIRLDLSSAIALAGMGAQPLASGVLSSPPTGSGIVTWNFLVPGAASLAGIQLGAQAVVVGPSGTIPFLPGVTAQVSSTFLITLGY